MANKTTKRDIINAMIADNYISANESYMAYLKHEIELLDKKAEAKKPTARQKENEELMEMLVEVVNATSGGTVSEIIASDSRLAGMTTQRISPMLNKLAEEGKITKTIEKRKGIFSAI